MTVGGMGFIPERLLMMMMMIILSVIIINYYFKCKHRIWVNTLYMVVF